uniref:Fe2OG dioxygenase domain-containing protein n=1 Tax=Chrysotila carterae TaxID=13221 RepID=A0A7S4C3D4_CHRCT
MQQAREGRRQHALRKPHNMLARIVVSVIGTDMSAWLSLLGSVCRFICQPFKSLFCLLSSSLRVNQLRVQQEGSLLVLSTKCDAPRLMHAGIRSKAFCRAHCQCVVSKINFNAKWTQNRHTKHPTYDCDVQSVDGLEEELDRLVEKCISDISWLFRIERNRLFLREHFIVLYEEHGQRGLESHRDASFFSFIVQLNDPREFSGGGTYFSHLGAPIQLSQGDALLFVGRNLHAGKPIRSGRRMILAGFVDLRASTNDLFKLYAEVQRADPSSTGTLSRELPQPQLWPNVRTISLCAGKRGKALLQSLAARRARGLAHVDLEGMSLALRHLACAGKGMPEKAARTAVFAQRVLMEAPSGGWECQDGSCVCSGKPGAGVGFAFVKKSVV